MKIPALLLAAWATAFAASSIVIKDATILTVTKGTYKGSIVVEGGKIREAGATTGVPPGAQVLDAAGLYVMPGIIDPHSHIATAGGVNEGAPSVSSMAAVKDVLDPADIAIYRALAGGVTTVNVIHGSANAVGGQYTVVKLRWGQDASGLLFQGAPPGLKLAMGENPKRRGNAGASRTPTDLRYPATRMGVEDVIRGAFAEARAYRTSWQQYHRAVERGERAVPPRRDLKLEPLVEVLEGKRLVHAHCYRSDEIVAMIRIAQDFGFRIHAMIHVLEGYKVAREMREQNAGATTFSDWWAYKVEAYDAIPYNAALMHRRGVLVSLNSDSAELMRRMNTEAAKAVKYGGLTEDEALALITLNPARQLGIENQVGSIEPGKDADLTFFDKHPLSSYAKVVKVFIDGQEYFDREKDLAARASKGEKKKALIEAERAAQKKAAPARRPS
jgi:imidazolonepropionase-like amidohydrolase